MQINHKTLEIVGLDGTKLQTKCGIHPTTCGASVRPGMHLKLLKGTMDVSKEVTIETEIDTKRFSSSSYSVFHTQDPVVVQTFQSTTFDGQVEIASVLFNN